MKDYVSSELGMATLHPRKGKARTFWIFPLASVLRKRWYARRVEGPAVRRKALELDDVAAGESCQCGRRESATKGAAHARAWTDGGHTRVLSAFLICVLPAMLLLMLVLLDVQQRRRLPWRSPSPFRPLEGRAVAAGDREDANANPRETAVLEREVMLDITPVSADHRPRPSSSPH